MSSPLFSLGAAEIAWILLAAALAALMYWLFMLQRKISKLQSCLASHSRSISFTDDWADDVDTRIAIIQAVLQVENDNSGPAAPSTTPFLDSIVGDNQHARHIDTAKVRTIIAGLKGRQSPTD